MKSPHKKKEKYNPKDEYYSKAKKEGFVARSVFKLEEIDKKHRIFKPGMRILDLGCAPGSWLQYSAKKVGNSGKLLGIDLDPVRVNLPNVKTIVGSLYDFTLEQEDLKSLIPVDVIQSDAMTKTTGIAETDCARSIALVEHGLHLAYSGALKKGGAFLAKVFEGPGFTPFYVEFKRKFSKTAVLKPEAIRTGSREVYILGMDFKG